MTLIRADRLTTSFRVDRGLLTSRTFDAVHDVTLDVRAGEVLALVGESGSGKTTLGRTLLGLVRPTRGSVWYEGRDVARLPERSMRALRRELQFVFQDPFASLDPRMRVEAIVGEGLRIHRIGSRAEQARRVEEALIEVGLAPAFGQRFPHELSGGQRQRVGIARALILDPRFVVADEPVSSLDVSIQAQIIALLDELRRQRGIALLFITHNLGVVRVLSDRVAVMYLGRIVEVAPTGTLFASPAHPYTRSLLAAIPWPDPGRRMSSAVVTTEAPSAIDPPSGCVFRTRCAFAVDACMHVVPALAPLDDGHGVACIRRDILRSAGK